MQSPPLRRGTAAQSVEAFTFESKLDNEEATLDAILASMGRGTLHTATWERLRAAAQRDGRISELAFAFESASQAKRIKALPPALAAEFLFQAACFFADAFGDELGAVTYLERALALLPTHAPSFIKIDQILHKTQQLKKLASVCATVAQHRTRGEQPGLLRRAADLLMQAGGSDDKVIELLQHVLRLEPGDEQAREQLEALCIKANRLRDVARLNEQALGAEPPPDEPTRKKLLSRIVEVYADKLHEPERALPHVEQLLMIDPANEQGRKVAQKLVVVKGLAGRAAAALANAHEAFGTPQEVARYLTVELENTRGPKRAGLLARLGRLKGERLGDLQGAFEVFEQALAVDAADDDLRARYVALARKLGRTTDAVKALGRVMITVKSPDAKARASAQLAEMQLLSGDARRAKATLTGVLAAAEAPADALLAAAYTLVEIHQTEKDARALGDVLERLSGLEPDAGKRQAVDEQLAEVASELGDSSRAIAAYERLLSTSTRPGALAALAPLYEAAKDPEKHAWLLEEQAKDIPDATEARRQMMRAAEVRASATADAAAAIASCRAIIDRFGPARDVLAVLLPLLEGQRRWPELARAFAHEGALTEGLEHANVMTRLGTLQMQRLGDMGGAIQSLSEALAFHAGDKTARMMLEKLTVIGDHRLAAARVLEPLYRQQGASGPLLKMLELRGTLEPDVDQRLTALREAAPLADGAEAGRAADVVGRALADAVANDRPLGEWFERFDTSGQGADTRRRATILGQAIGDREVTSEDMSRLAKHAAEAHAAAGDAETAIALYRRALAYEPHSTELLLRIDDLLRDQGSPRERIALYRAALVRGGAGGRKALLHRIGAIERDDLEDLPAAIETYQAALHDDSNDADARAALRDLYARSGRWSDLCVLLETWLTRVDGEAARSTRAMLALVAATHDDPLRARTQCARLLEDPQLEPEHLDAVGQAAHALGDRDLERAVLQRRADLTQEPREQIVWLDRLAELEAERRGDLGAAAGVWKRAASLAEGVGDDDAARRMYWRALKVAPQDRDVTTRLVSLCERAQSWEDLPGLYVSLADQSSDETQRVELWVRTARTLSEKLGDVAGAAHHAAKAFKLAPARADVLSVFEELSVAAGAADIFEHVIDETFTRLDSMQTLGGEMRVQLLLARARVLASDSGRVNDAARAYRALLDDRSVDRGLLGGALAAFEALILASPNSPDRRADRRWLLEWRAEHASEEERAARLLEWAREEEESFSEPLRALGLYRRAHELDPESDDALSAMTRLALASGDTDEALSALRARRDRADGPARIGVELEIAQVLLSKTTRWQDALAALRAVLDEVPNDAMARGLAEQLLAHRSTRADTIRLLERACDASDDAAARMQILTRLLDAPAEAGDYDARCGWFERLSDLQRETGSPETAMATAVRAAREMPEVATLWDRAEGLARALSRPEEMAALYEEVLARALTSEQARPLGERAVQFYEEWFEDSARVVRILERVLALDPNADWAFDRLKLLLDAAERWDDLFVLYDQVLESATGRKRTMLLEDAAQTAKDFADRPDRAIHYLEQLNALKPGDAKLTSALERLYERQGRHRELVGLLTARLPALKRDEAERARARVALLWLDGLGDPVAAFDVIEPVLQRAGDSASGAASDVWLLLERILSAAGPTTEMRRSTVPPPRNSERPAPRSKRARKSEPPPTSPTAVRQRAAAWLREHYATTGRDADLVRMLLVELEGVKTAKERVRRHVQIAESYEKLGDPASALEQVGHAVVLDPHDDAKRAKLAQLADRTGRLERLADLLTAAGDASDDKALRIALTMQAAAVRADQIADVAGAIALLSSVLATERLSHADLLAAGRKLEPLLRAAGREEEQLDVLERIANVEPDEGGKREALGRAARLAAQLGQDVRAISLWERRIQFDDQDADALDGLVTLLERAGRSERLAELLELRARAASSDDRRRSDRVRVANLLGDLLDRPKDAIAAWRKIEHDFGEADDVAFALARLLQATQRWKELAQLLERGAERTSDDAARAELLRQLGDLHRVELDAQVTAVDTYARALSADPRNMGAHSGLLALAEHDALRATSVNVLLEALRTCDDWRAVLDLTAQRLLAARSDSEKIGVLREAAQISEHRACDPGRAFDAIYRAFVIAPGDDEIEREMARLAEVAAAWQRIVEAYREAIEGAAKNDSALVARLRAKAGVTLESRLDDPRGALTAYLQVVRDSSDVDAACAALRVAGALAEWEEAGRVVVDVVRVRGAAAAELLDAYAVAAERAGSWNEATRALATSAATSGLQGAPARDVQARIAVWHRDCRNDPDAAQAALEGALAHDDSNAPLLAMLAELQRRRPGRPLVDTLQRLSRASGDDLALLREAAEVAREECGDLPLARDILKQLLAIARAQWDAGTSIEAPGHAEWAIENLAQLHETEGDARSIVGVLVQGDALPFELSVRRGMRRRAARVALDCLGDDEQAIPLYLALFHDDAHDAEAAERLASIYTRQGRARELLSLRERQIASAGDASSRIALRLEAAQLLIHVGESARAAEMLRVSLGEDERNEGTVEALAKLLDEQALTHELRDLLVDQAQHAERAGDLTRATELWWRAAVLAEQHLRDDDAAEAYYARVAALEPRPASLDALGRLATARGDHRSAAEWLERFLQVVDIERRVEATLRLADAWVGAGEAAIATERLAQAVMENPHAEPIRDRLAGLYRDQNDWARLALLVADAAAHAPDKGTRMARLLEAARLFTARCAQPELAIPLLEQATDLMPDDQPAALALADAFARSGRFDDARGLLKSMVEAFGGRRPKERAPVHYQIARLELAMDNRARALVELDTAARVDPQNPDILRALAELARDDGQFERAEKSYRALLAVLRRRGETGEAQGIARSEVLLELSAIAQRQGERERAQEILESAIETASHGDFEHERLEGALRARGDHETLVRVLESKLARAGDDPPAAAKTLSELAELLADRLGRPGQALAARLRAVGLDPRSDIAHERALTLARSLKDAAQYVDGVSALVERAIDQGDVPLACVLLVRLGSVAESDLADEPRAAALYERGVELGLRTPEVLRALDRVFDRLGDTQKQARMLAMRIEVETQQEGPQAASDATYRLAALRLASRETLDSGVELMEAALRIDPQWDRAEDALRRAATIDPTRGGVLDLYEFVGRQPGRERALVDALRARAELPGAETKTTREAVQVAARIGDAVLAESLLRRFVEREQGSGENVAGLAWALDSLANLRHTAGDLEKAVELKRAAARMADPEVARKLSFEVARLAAHEMARWDLAAETYERLHRADPADRDAWEPLLAVYRHQGDTRKLIELLATVVDYVDDTSVRARLRLERVRAMQELGLSDAEAAPLLREIVDEDASQVEAALMLAAILERSGDRSELTDLFAHQIDAAKDRSDSASIVSLSTRLGALLEPSAPLQARNVYYTALEWEPKSIDLLDRLARLLDGERDAAERADVLERRLAVEKGPGGEPMALALWTARIDLGDESAAARALELGYRAYPASAMLRERLEAIFRDHREWRKLAELCELDASARDKLEERVARLREAATIWRTEVRDAHRGATALRLARIAAEALRDGTGRPDAELLRDHIDLLMEAGDPASALAELTAVIERLAADDSLRAALLAARANVRLAAQDEKSALEDLEAAFAIDPTYAPALIAQLERARTAATQEGDSTAVRGHWMRQAQVAPYAGNSQEARDILVELLKQEPKDCAALRALANLEQGLERWDAASAALKRLVGLEDAEGTVETALRLADVCERAGRPGDARGALERARSVAPHERMARRRLERVYEQSGAWHELADLVLEDARASGEVAERFELLLRAGSLLLEQAGDSSAGIEALEEARALRPLDPGCVARLADAYTQSGRAQDAALILEPVIAPHKGRRPRELAPLYYRLARVARYFGNTAEEVRSLVLALECDSQNGEVCSDVALRAMEVDQLDLASRALRAITLLKTPGPMSKALAYQYMGEIARKQGDSKRALTLLNRALSEDPSLEGARALLVTIERG